MTVLPALLPAAEIGKSFAETAFSGAMLLAIPVALLAGLVSFLSPCVLPLVPGYLGYVGSLSAAGAGAGSGSGQASRRESSARLAGGVALFVAGFTAVFVVYGVLAGSVGGALREHADTVSRVLGVVVIVMGLVFMGFVPFLQTDARRHVSPRAGLWGAPLLGIVFAIGWTPCIGPTLAAILALGLESGSAGRGAVLAVAFCLGLGLPFVLAAFGIGRSERVLGFLRRHRLAIMRLGGGLLVLLGLALVTGLWSSWALWLQGLFTSGETFIPVV